MCWISNRGWGCLRDLSSKANDEIPIGNVVKIMDEDPIECSILESVWRIGLLRKADIELRIPQVIFLHILKGFHTVSCQQKLKWSIKHVNQSFQHGFEVIYLDNIVGPCYRWVWVLECWNFFPGLLTYVLVFYKVSLFKSGTWPQQIGCCADKIKKWHLFQIQWKEQSL